MAPSNSAHRPGAFLSPQPIGPAPQILLPQLPIAVQRHDSIFPTNECPKNVDSSSSFNAYIHGMATVARASEKEALIEDAEAADTPVTSRNGNGKRKGPPEVQWDASKDRKYARLYSLSDVDIHDLPIIMRDDELKFEKRIAQEKSSNNLGPWPNELRPSHKDPKQMDERIKQAYLLKSYLTKSTGQMKQKPADISHPAMLSTTLDIESLGGVLEGEMSLQKWHGDNSLSQVPDALGDFTYNPMVNIVTGDSTPTARREIRTSYASLQSLRRRLKERVIKSRPLRDYSDEELLNFIRIKKRLSVGSLPTNPSETSSLLSKRTSESSSFSTSSRQSTSTIIPVADIESSDSSRLPRTGRGSGNSFDKFHRPAPASPLRQIFEARRPNIELLKSSISSPVIQSSSNIHAFTSSGKYVSKSFSLEKHQLYRKNNAHDQDDERARVQVSRGTARMCDYWNLYGVHDVFKVEGFPSIEPTISEIKSHGERVTKTHPARSGPSTRPQLTSSPQTFSTQPTCCLSRFRGDPRAGKCEHCVVCIPKAHIFVRWLIEQWRMGKNIVEEFSSKPVYVDFGEVDEFGDTVLHLASSLGAGYLIISWFISMGVNVHAKNVAGQTFMHVFDPVAFSRHSPLETDIISMQKLELLFNSLKARNFDFNAQDDFGQTPLHVLTQYWLHLYTLQVLLKFDFAMESTFSKRDFRARTVEDQMKAQANIDEFDLPDQMREISVEILLYNRLKKGPDRNFFIGQDEPVLVSLGSIDKTKETRLVHATMRDVISTALSGHPDAEFNGKNSLHCLAESCISLWVDFQDQFPPCASLKRKDQVEITLQHNYIVETARRLLEVGVDPNDYDTHGNTPLIAFIRNDLSSKPERKITADVLQILINGGASVHRRTRKSETALHIAMRLGRPSAVEVLLKNHANIHARARHGEGIMTMAAKASLRAKRDGALYHRIITCIAIAGDYHAVLDPSRKDEWDEQKACVARAAAVKKEKSQGRNKRKRAV